MSIHKKFTIDLISNASMGIFTNITLAKFRNQLAQPLQLDGDWQIALSSISFPSNINNVNSVEIVAYELRTNSLRYIQEFRRASEKIFRIAQLKNFEYDFANAKNQF